MELTIQETVGIPKAAEIAGSKSKDHLALLGNGGFLLAPTPAGTIFIREQLQEEQLELGKTVRNFIDNKVIPKVKEIETKQQDADGTFTTVRLMKEFGKLGILSVDLPEEYGGLESDLTTTMYLVENIGTGVASFTTTALAHMGIGTLPILFFGTPEQRAKYLPKLGSGENIGCYCLTESESGSDALSGKTKAVLEGDFYILNGEKQFATNGGWADVAIVFARIQDQYSALIVDLHTPGVQRAAEEKKMGIQGSSTTGFHFDNVKVPKENLLGKIGDGPMIAFNILNMGRTELAFASVGGAKRTLKMTLEYARQRKQFGRPIIEFDTQMARFAEMIARTFAVDSLLYRNINATDKKIAKLTKGPDYWENVAKTIRAFAMEASVAKVEGSEMLFECTCNAVRMLGGYGYMYDYSAERHMRDSVINLIFEGTNDINRLVIFDFLVKNIYSEGIPFTTFMDEVDRSLRKRTFQYPGDKTILGDEKSRVYAGKYLLGYLLNEGLMKFGKDVKNNQQFIRHISNIIIQLYAVDSTLARVHWLIENNRKEASYAKRIAELVTYNTLSQVRGWADEVAIELFEGHESSSTRDKIAWLIGLTKGKENPNRLKREIAQTVLDKGLLLMSL